MRLYLPHWLGNLTSKFPKLSRGSPLFSSLEVWGEQRTKEEDKKYEEKEVVSDETRKEWGERRWERKEKGGKGRENRRGKGSDR